MRLFVKFMIFVLIAALAGPFFLKGPDGRPLWSWQSVRASVIKQWHSLTGDMPEVVVGSDDVTVYRWRDANGQWQFAATPPAGVQAESLVIDPDTNVISLPSLPQPEPAPAVAPDAEPAPVPAAIPILPDPEMTRQLIEDAKALEGKIAERDQKIRELD